MGFKDFQPKELIGKWVHISNRHNEWVKKITRVTKTGFGVEDSDSLYSLNNGHLKGRTAWYMESASLISEDEKNRLTSEWNKVRDMRAMKSTIENSLKVLSYEQMKKIVEIINPKQ